MRIRTLQYGRYRVPFRQSFRTAHGAQKFREGLLVRLIDEDGVAGYGEAAPLEAFGTGTVEGSQAALYVLHDLILGVSTSDLPGLLVAARHDTEIPAPVRFAIDTARLDIEARRAGLSLGRYLGGHDRDAVPVNATIGSTSISETVAASKKAVSSGFSTLKLKVGNAQDLDREIARIAAVRDEVGRDIELRLDANGAFTPGRAREFCDRLDELDIAYLEQPLPADQIDELAELRSVTDVPIAIDEAATPSRAVQRVLTAGAADVVILKPGVIGTVSEFQQILESTLDAGVQTVVTTVMDCGVGVAAALHLATLLPEPIPACGLATLDLLDDDLIVKDLQIDKGEMRLPDSPGLGVIADGASTSLRGIRR